MSPVEQGLRSCPGPSQPPPHLGGGLAHSLSLLDTPSAQDTEQGFHGPHSPHPPCSAK